MTTTNMTPNELRAWVSMAHDGTLSRYIGLRGCEPLYARGRRGVGGDTVDYRQELSRRAQAHTPRISL